MRVLLVESDTILVKGLMTLFRARGVVADNAETGSEAFELLRHYEYDLVLSECGASSSPDLLRRMRAARNATPVIVLCAAHDSQARVQALAAGADDVLAKPFDPQELIARMQAIVRRVKGFAEAALTVGPLTLRQDSHEVTVNGRDVKLTGKEYAILELLVLRKGTVQTKDAFLNHIYGGMDEPEAKIIDVFICKLRKKLGIAGADNLITTVWGRGYMLKEPRVFAEGLPALPVLPGAIVSPPSSRGIVWAGAESLSVA